MPLFYRENLGDDICLGVWEIEEEEIWFSEKWQLSDDERHRLNHLKGRKRLEFLSARHLVHLLTELEPREPLQTDINGKPFFPQKPNWHFSISHSHKYAAAIISKNRKVGIDIQLIVPQMRKVASRVFSQEELSFVQKDYELEMLHIFWGIKEAVFKAYGFGGVDFKEQIKIQKFDFQHTNGKFSSYLIKENRTLIYEGYYFFFPDGYVSIYLSEVAQV